MYSLSDLIGSIFGAIVFAVISGFLLLVVVSAMHASGLMLLTYVTLSMGALFVLGCLVYCAIEIKDYVRYKNLV